MKNIKLSVIKIVTQFSRDFPNIDAYFEQPSIEVINLISNYPGKITQPEGEVLDHIVIYPSNSDQNFGECEVPLWFDNRPSDITCDIDYEILSDGTVKTKIYDVHVK